jgi:uncharacterized protein (TIGR04255 family)
VRLLTSESVTPSGRNFYQQIQAGRHYDRAPVTEAIIEVTCVLDPNVTLEDLARVADPDAFSASPAFTISGRIDVTPDGIKGDTSGEQVGHVLRRNDGKRAVQSRLNGFAYSIMAPYSNWETFSAEAWQQWQSYAGVAHPATVARLGVRYINRIDVPQPIIEIKDYLRTAVDVSPYLPQSISRYFLQVIVPLPDFDSVATITSTLVPPPSEEQTSLILDIDAWRAVDISLVTRSGEERLRETLNELHDAKNYVFEACITDATRGLIS